MRAALSPVVVCQSSKHSKQAPRVVIPIARCTQRPTGWHNNDVGENSSLNARSAKFPSRGGSTSANAMIMSRGTDEHRDGGGSSHNWRNMEDSVTAIVTDVVKHCFNKECDGMREKVVDQLGRGLAALLRVSVGVAAESSSSAHRIPILKSRLAVIEDRDLEQVRRLLQLTSLPFHNTYDEDLRELTTLLQAGEGHGRRRLTGSELSQIRQRIGSDLVQCLGPLAMSFPELPLWAKHRALLLPAQVAGKVALGLLAGPKQR